jgi:ribosomal protein S27AE
MDLVTQEMKQKIVAALTERGATLDCPRCGNGNFILLDGYFRNIVQPDVMNFHLDGNGVPSVVTICDRCGFMSQHALGILGLLPQTEPQTIESSQ